MLIGIGVDGCKVVASESPRAPNSKPFPTLLLSNASPARFSSGLTTETPAPETPTKQDRNDNKYLSLSALDPDDPHENLGPIIIYDGTEKA